jgi:hypothetical protein
MAASLLGLTAAQQENKQTGMNKQQAKETIVLR